MFNRNAKAKRKEFKSMSTQFDLEQIIEGSARIAKSSETVIDLLLTKRPERIKKCYNLATELSDQNMIIFLKKLK